MLAKLPCKSMRVLRVWDRDKRDTRIASGKAAPAIGSRQVGDTVLYCRDSRSGKHELRRNARSRLNGFDKDENSLSETQPRDSMFVLMFTDCLHPSCKIVELLVFRFTRTKDFTPLATETQTQHDFIDEHFSFADPSRFVNDDQDDEMPEPTQTTRAEKRKVDETAKELRTLVPLISFSQESSTRPESETHEQLTQSTIQARIARTRAEALQDVSSMFLRARMVDAPGEEKERTLTTKNGKR